MNPFKSIRGVWLSGLLASAVLVAAFAVILRGALVLNPLDLLRVAHVIGAILWIGLLYYFVFVQGPAVAAATAQATEAPGGPGPAAIMKYVAPRALLWFRWSALATWVIGALHLALTERFIFVFSLGQVGAGDPGYGMIMGLGAWLGTILLFNVWVLIWPAQRRILGLAGVKSPEKIESAKKRVNVVARIGAVLTFPILFLMTLASHGLGG